MRVVRVILSVLAITSLSLTAHAACTREQAAAREQEVYERSGLVQMIDLQRGRAMLTQLLAIHFAGLTSGPNVDWDDVCARYDAILAQGSPR
jgi:hypothetical protein